MFDIRLAESLEAHLAQKQEFLNQIVVLTDLQTDLIQGEDIQPLMDNIEGRQNLIDVIDRLDAEVSSVATAMGEPDQSPEWTAFRARLRERNERMRETLLRIDAQDKRNESIATAKIMEYQKDIQTVKLGGKSVAAYSAPPPAVEGTYFDKKK